VCPALFIFSALAPLKNKGSCRAEARLRGFLIPPPTYRLVLLPFEVPEIKDFDLGTAIPLSFICHRQRKEVCTLYTKGPK